MSLKIVVTGGAGYVGSSLVEKLCSSNLVNEVIVYDNLSIGNHDFFFNSNLDKAKVRFIEGDILETQKLSKLVKDADVVVHLASLDTQSTENSTIHHLEQINHWGTAELTYAIERSEVKKLIFISSAEVYGFSDNINIESSEVNPISPYAQSKFRAEAHINRLSPKVETYIVRSGTVIGDSSVKSSKGVGNRMFYDSLIRNRVSVHGNGKQVRPILSMNYLVSTITNAVLGSFSGGIYNVSQSNVQVLDILEELKKLRPNTEFIFTNHHLQLPSLLMATNFLEILPKQNLNISQEFEDILKRVKI